MIRVTTSFLLFLLGGCIAFETGPVSKNETPGTLKESTVNVIGLDKIRTVISPNSGCAELAMEAIGEFEVGYVQDVDVVESVYGRTAFGFFPWTLADRPAETPVVDHILACLVNYGLAMSPTLYSLLFEPFSDYPQNGINDHVFAGFSLFGFYRYIDVSNVKKSYTVKRRPKRSVNIYRFSDFSVEFDGKEISTTSGRILLPRSYESGMEIKCKLLSVKIPQGNFNLYLKQYLGRELSWQATGVKRMKTPVKIGNVQAGCIDKSSIVGEWESYQSCKVISSTLNHNENIERNQIIHCTYSFFDDGRYHQKIDMSGKIITLNGNWAFNNNSISLKLKDKQGVEELQIMTITKSDNGKLLLRYENLDVFARIFHEGVKPTKAEYDKSANIIVEREINNRHGDNETNVINYIYSPLFLERNE